MWLRLKGRIWRFSSVQPAAHCKCLLTLALSQRQFKKIFLALYMTRMAIELNTFVVVDITFAYSISLSQRRPKSRDENCIFSASFNSNGIRLCIVVNTRENCFSWLLHALTGETSHVCGLCTHARTHARTHTHTNKYWCVDVHCCVTAKSLSFSRWWPWSLWSFHSFMPVRLWCYNVSLKKTESYIFLRVS